MSDLLWQKPGVEVDARIMRFLAGDDVVLDREFFLHDIAASKAHVEGLQRIGIDSSMLFQTVFRTFLKILQIPVGLCHTDDGNRDSLVANQPQKSGKYLFVSEIATRTEENNCVR